MLSPVCVIPPKNDTHQLIYKMEINSQTWIMNLQSRGGGRWGWRTVWEFGIDTCQCLTLDTMQVVSNSLQPAWTAACQASLSLIISQSLPKFMSIASTMPSSHLILTLSSPSALNLSQHQGLFQWVICSHQMTKILELHFSISSSSEYSGLISLKIYWLDRFVVQGTFRSLIYHHSLKASILWCSSFFMVQFSQSYVTTGKMISWTIWTFVHRVMSLLFNTLSRFVISFLPRSIHLLISWLQSLSTVILETKKRKSVTLPPFPLLFAMK